MNTLRKAQRERPTGREWLVVPLTLAYLFSSGSVAGQTPQKAQTPDALHQLNDSIEALVQRVSPTVVQIQVTGYGSTQEAIGGQTSVVVGRQRAVGSGVIVDPEGYIVTNAHVVNGAEKIEVIVPPSTGGRGRRPSANPDTRERSYDARIVGVTREIDLAVIKIEAHGLPALSIQSSVPLKARRNGLCFRKPRGLAEHGDDGRGELRCAAARSR